MRGSAARGRARFRMHDQDHSDRARSTCLKICTRSTKSAPSTARQPPLKQNGQHAPKQTAQPQQSAQHDPQPQQSRQLSPSARIRRRSNRRRRTRRLSLELRASRECVPAPSAPPAALRPGTPAVLRSCSVRPPRPRSPRNPTTFPHSVRHNGQRMAREWSPLS